MSSGAKFLNGVFWAFIQRVGVVLTSFISNIILARLLSPDDYGCIGMLMIFIAISNAFIDGGFGSALIQKKSPTQEDYSTIFHWNLFLSVVLYGVLFMAAPWVASFYKIELLSSVLRVQGIVLIINALSIVQQNILRKRLLFRHLAVVRISASVLSLLLAVFLAYRGYGVWTLVAQQIAWSCFATAFCWALNVWRPSMQFSMQSFKSLYQFGGFILLSNMVTAFTENVQGVIIGRMFTPATTGLYAQAKKLEEAASTTLATIVDQVSYPVFAEAQDDSERFQLILRKIITVSAYVCMPILCLLIVVAEPVISWLYSDKWIACVPYFRILCVAGVVKSIINVHYFSIAAKGRSKLLFRLTLVQSVWGVVCMLVGVYVGGVYGLLWGMVLSIYTNYMMYAVLSSNITGYKLMMQLRDLLPILCVAALTAIATYYVGTLFHAPVFLTFVLQALVYGGVYVGCSLLFQLRSIQWLKELVRSIRKK